MSAFSVKNSGLVAFTGCTTSLRSLFKIFAFVVALILLLLLFVFVGVWFSSLRSSFVFMWPSLMYTLGMPRVTICLINSSCWVDIVFFVAS